MSYILPILGILISLLFIIGVIWHFASQRWQLPCPAWLEWMVELDNPFTKINRSVNIINALELEPGMQVLDAGCGPGRLTIPMAQKIGSKGEVSAVDIQEGMLARVKEKATSADLHNIVFILAGLGDGKLEKNRYDRATLVTVLGEIPDQQKALEEIFYSLKPGGILSITETLFDPHYQKFNRVLALALQIGFQKKNVFSDSFSYNVLLQKPV